MSFQELLKKISDRYQKQLPFVVYALPESTTITGLFQNAQRIPGTDFQNGFVFAPFFSEDKKLHIPFSESEVFAAKISSIEVDTKDILLEETENDRLQHLDLVKTAIQTIENGKAEKIVVSRSKEVRLENFNIAELAIRLFSMHSNAFRYIWFHPETAVWCGATPEVLVTIANNTFKTMALAGTKKVEEHHPIHWTDKERKEQHFVTQAIVENLNKLGIDHKLSETETHFAGNVAHLRTDISGNLEKEKFSLNSVLKALHPTPAVCGTPRDIAREFIKVNEHYNRNYYTGYLGPIQNKGLDAHLFVNLRCMSIKENVASIYVGGGIVGNSDAESEWEETRNKLQTMAKVLQPLL